MENEIVDIEEKKSTYNPAVKKAIDKYRSKNVDKYNLLQREYYNEAKEDPEWKEKFNARCKENNKKYRERLRLENPPKAIGRPRKPLPQIRVKDILYNI